MKHVSKLLGAAGTAALMSVVANPAYAAGTAAGTSIVNQASISFQVGGVTQTAVAASNTIVVDAKIVLTAVETGAVTSVAPGQTGAITSYQVTNSSNQAIDIALSAAAQTSGTAANGSSTVNVTATSPAIFVNTTPSATCNTSNVGTSAVTAATYLDTVQPGTTLCVYVTANIPVAATNGGVAGVDLTATAAVVGSPTTPITASGTGTAWTPGTVQVVFADAAGNGGDAAYDGKYTALGQFNVAAPILTVSKNSTIVSDPTGNSTAPKAIPGAVVKYCIIVANAAGAGASASNISISDVLPSTVTYNANSIVLNTTVTGSTCGSGTSGSDSTNYASSTSTITGSLATLAAGTSEGISYQVTIN